MKALARILLVSIGVTMAILLPQGFIHMDFLIRGLSTLLPLKVDPAYTGGRILGRYSDPFGDDFGPGTLVYPRHEAWSGKNILDLVRYTVHEPLIGAKWSRIRDFWQIELGFASLGNTFGSESGFSNAVITIYIDIDGTAGGSTETRVSRAEMVRFDPEFPWDYMIHIDGYRKAVIESADGSYTQNVQLFPDPENAALMMRIPLEANGLLRVLDHPVTHHYVLVGAYSQTGRENFSAVQATATSTIVGGATSRLTPRVYDYLAPRGLSQKTILSSYNEADGSYAQLVPIVVDRDNPPATGMTAERLSALKNAAEAESGTSAAISPRDEIRSQKVSDEEHFIALFRCGYIEEAGQLGEMLFKNNPDSGVILAYLASITAIEGGRTEDIAESVRLVNEAFTMFESAQRLMKTDAELLHLYMNRGSVCKSVPDLVFGKALQGASDFLAAAGIFESMEEPGASADALYQAGLCFEIAGKPDKADLAYLRVLASPGLSAKIRYELALKGYDD